MSEILQTDAGVVILGNKKLTLKEILELKKNRETIHIQEEI